MRARRRLNTHLTPLSLAVFGMSLSGCGAGAQTMNGTYSIALPEGTATLSLSVSSTGTVHGWMQSVDGSLFQATGREFMDDEGDVVVEGTLAGGMSADFELYEEESPEFGLLRAIVHGPGGAVELGRDPDQRFCVDVERRG